MKVLITGGMGVMGAEATRKFVQEGHRPVIFARHRNESLIRDIVDKVDIELGDITDLPSLMHAVKKHSVTHIVHVAALVGAGCDANPPLAVQINAVGTVNVLETARLFDIKRVVYISAKGVYGPFVGEYGYPTYKPVPEDHKTAPVRLYDSTKFMGENLALYYQANLGLDVIALRFGTTYGPGKSAKGVHGVVGRIIEDPAHGRPFQLLKGGDEKDDFVYCKDAALGIYLTCMVENPKSRLFNIGSGVGVSLKDFGNVVRKYLPNASIEVGPGLCFLEKPNMYGVFDITRAAQELGYRPQFDLDRAVGDYLDAMKRMNL
jgi:UDP-glucose 4-epimerase